MVDSPLLLGKAKGTATTSRQSVSNSWNTFWSSAYFCICQA